MTRKTFNVLNGRENNDTRHTHIIYTVITATDKKNKQYYARKLKPGATALDLSLNLSHCSNITQSLPSVLSCREESRNDRHHPLIFSRQSLERNSAIDRQSAVKQPRLCRSGAFHNRQRITSVLNTRLHAFLASSAHYSPEYSNITAFT
jgi:hypothetical protein